MIMHQKTLSPTLDYLWTRFKRWSISISSYLSSGEHDRAAPSHSLMLNREEDVSKTMYRETLKIVPAEKHLLESEAINGSDLSKANRICDAFLKVLESRGPAHIQNIITAHVCKVPPNLDAGLAEIGTIRSKTSLYYAVHDYLSAYLLPRSFSHLLVDRMAGMDSTFQ